MLFEITYDYSVKVGERWQTYNDLVGRDGYDIVGYGPTGPSSLFYAVEIWAVVKALTVQLGVVPTLHLHPRPY